MRFKKHGKGALKSAANGQGALKSAANSQVKIMGFYFYVGLGDVLVGKSI